MLILLSLTSQDNIFYILNIIGIIVKFKYNSSWLMTEEGIFYLVCDINMYSFKIGKFIIKDWLFYDVCPMDMDY